MCLLALAWRHHPAYPLLVIANRDEFHARPTTGADWWTDPAGICAGRDLQAGGTWMGVTRSGRFAALTNYRDPTLRREGSPSRGQLVVDSLLQAEPTTTSLAAVAARSEPYEGFNLLVCDGETLGIHESVSGQTGILPPGVYALSNGSLDSNWPKVKLARQRLHQALAEVPLNRLRTEDRQFQTRKLEQRLLLNFHDARPVADADLPQTGVSLEWERLLSAMFIVSPEYGTRSTSFFALDEQGWADFSEWRWNSQGETAGHSHRRWLSAAG